MATYTPITLAEMREVLRESNGWQQVDPQVLALANISEHVFEWQISGVGKPVKVYTSIDVHTGVTRSVGSDAIRVCVPGWLKSQRVHRVEGWRTNLVERVRAAIQDVRERYAKTKPPPQPAVEEKLYQSVLALFASAAESKLKRPAVRFEGGSTPVRIQLAGPNSKYAGNLIVTDGGGFGASTFYGWVSQDGYWHRTKYVTPAVASVMDGLAADPAGFAAEYGKKSGACCFCARHLETAESLHVGYGPICADKFGLPWGAVGEEAGIAAVEGGAE